MNHIWPAQVRRAERRFQRYLTILLVAVLLAIGVAVWAVVSSAPARQAAWIADCTQRGFSAEQCKLLYHEAWRRDDGVAIAVGRDWR
jgi:hypothetical protein